MTKKRDIGHQVSFWEYFARDFPTEYDAFLEASPTKEISSSFVNHYRKIHGWPGMASYKNIVVSISGGADSDRMLDLIERIGHPESEVHYVFFDTGMEYKATKNHLIELEKKYGIKIEHIKSKTPVAVAVKKYGYPFLSKQISQYIHRLQLHGFRWEDKPFEELFREYPRCKAALRWWCNEWGEGKRTNINNRRYLKEFLIAHPPTIPISDICCEKAKKCIVKHYMKSIGADLNVYGVRKAEGGARASGYSSCFADNRFGGGLSELRILFWWKKADCVKYDGTFGVEHSRCYTCYGLDRTGCACCPFGRNWQKELEAAKENEPNLYIVACHVFGPAYEYTKQYYKFVEEKTSLEAETEVLGNANT